MTIGHVNKFWGRDRGGVESVLHAQVCDLSRRGYHAAVLACRPLGTAPRPFPPGVAGRELPSPVVASMPLHPALPRALAQLQAASDIVHFHLPFPLAEAAALSLNKRVPWVATLHAEVVGHAPALCWAQRQVTERFLRRVDAIVVSSASASQLASLRAHQRRVRVIPFGFDLAPYLTAVRPRRPAGALPVLAFLGRLVPYKGLDVLLRAAVGLPAELHIIGEGRERQRLQALAAALGFGRRATFFGHLPDADLPTRLRAADIFVLPSRTQAETFGVSQVEAMAAGLPVVNTALATGTDWVSPHGLTGLTVTPDDPYALRAALVRMIGDREFRLACGRRARTRALTLFNVERRGPELAALYRQLASCPLPRPAPAPAALPLRDLPA
jgi:glycosyltransferase involved in cell wall biosynthesis